MPEATSFARREAEAQARRVAVLDAMADERDSWRKKTAFYYRSIEELVRFVVPPGARVLEIGCGTGDLLPPSPPPKGWAWTSRPACSTWRGASTPTSSSWPPMPSRSKPRRSKVEPLITSSCPMSWGSSRTSGGVPRAPPAHPSAYPHLHLLLQLPLEPVLRLASARASRCPSSSRTGSACRTSPTCSRSNHLEVVRLRDRAPRAASDPVPGPLRQPVPRAPARPAPPVPDALLHRPPGARPHPEPRLQLQRHRPLPQRARQRRRHRRPHPRHGARDRDRLRRWQLERRDRAGDRAAHRKGEPAGPAPAPPGHRDRQGRRRAQGVRRRHR